MIKKISELKGSYELSKKDQKSINGGKELNCPAVSTMCYHGVCVTHHECVGGHEYSVTTLSR